MNQHQRPILLYRPGGPPFLMPGPAANRLVPLSLRYCGAILQGMGYSVHELDSLIRTVNVGLLRAWAGHHQPSVAIFSIERFQHAQPEALFELARCLRDEADTKIIAIGPFPTHYPDPYLASGLFDAVLLGEPEATVSQTVDALLSGHPFDFPGVATKVDQGKKPVFVEDVDALPLPLRYAGDTEAYYCNYPLPIAAKAVWGSLIAGRGCSRGCTFCSPFDRITYGRKVRPRSIASIVEEAATLVASGVNVLSFEDDDPTFDRERTLALSEALTPLNVKWICHARLDEMDEALINAMAKSGCVMLKLGIESGSPRIISELAKGDAEIWRTQAIRVAGWARAAGMAVCGLFILGCPGETEKDLRMTNSLMLQARFDLIQLHFFTPYPGSRIHDRQPENFEPEILALLHHYDPQTPMQVRLSDVPPEKIQVWSSKMMRSFVLRPGYAYGHLRRFGCFYYHNPRVAARLLSGLTQWSI